MKAPAGDQEALVSRGGAYFVPSYLGSKGWVGIDLAPHAAPDWDEIESLLEQGWRLSATQKAVADYDTT